MPEYWTTANTAPDFGITSSSVTNTVAITNCYFDGTGANGTPYIRWDGPGSNVVINGENYPQKIPADIKRKRFVQPKPEILVPKIPKLELFDPSNIGEDSPHEFNPAPLDYDTLKPVGRIKDNHVYEVYEVSEKPWKADDDFYKDSIESQGLRKTPMGFYIKDDRVKYEFRYRKIIQLRQPPSIISPRHLMDKMFTPQELVARALLRRYVGDKEFKRYQKFGYIMMIAHKYVWKVPGERAKVHRILQYEKNSVINSYCVHFEDSKIPPTDACIMRMALINSGIDNLKEYSNHYTPSEYLKEVKVATVPHRQLTTLEAMKLVKAQYGI